MLWLYIAIACYLLFATVFLIDKYILTSTGGNSRLMAFCLGIFGLLGLLLIPFGLVNYPGAKILILALAAGAIRIWATYFYFSALNRGEASRTTTTIGAAQPIFSFWLIWFLSGGQVALTLRELAAFILLLVGSIIITAEKNFFTLKNIYLPLTASFLFSLSFVMSKFVYDSQPFISAFILIGFGSFGGALVFLNFNDVRKALPHLSLSPYGANKSKRFAILFIFNQFLGGIAVVLQSLAIALAPLASVAIINALAGVQYAFCLF